MDSLLEFLWMGWWIYCWIGWAGGYTVGLDGLVDILLDWMGWWIYYWIGWVGGYIVGLDGLVDILLDWMGGLLKLKVCFLLNFINMEVGRSEWLLDVFYFLFFT